MAGETILTICKRFAALAISAKDHAGRIIGIRKTTSRECSHEFNSNEPKAVIAGIKGIDIIDLVRDVLCDAIMHGGLDTECIDGKQWTWVAYTLMQDELPLLDLSTQTFYRRLNKLCDAGLIQKSPTNEDARKVFICLGKKAKLITSDRHNPYKNAGSGPFKNEGTAPYKNEGTPLQIWRPQYYKQYYQ
jgi:hypothetical protein